MVEPFTFLCWRCAIARSIGYDKLVYPVQPLAVNVYPGLKAFMSLTYNLTIARTLSGIGARQWKRKRAANYSYNSVRVNGSAPSFNEVGSVRSVDN